METVDSSMSQPDLSDHSSEYTIDSISSQICQLSQLLLLLLQLPPTIFLLSMLRCPPPSDQARKRKIATTSPQTGSVKGEYAELQNMPPAICVKQYPDENLQVSTTVFLRDMQGNTFT